MTSCAFPMEVLHGIFDCLQDDQAALSACSLTCHAWMPTCRPRLFRKVKLDYKGDSCERFLYALHSSTSTDVPIAECVREVKVGTSNLTFGVGHNDAQGHHSMVGNWTPDPITLPNGAVVTLGDQGPLSMALGPVLQSLPHLKRLCISSFNWNDFAPMTNLETATGETYISAPLSLFAGLACVKSITLTLAVFNSPSEVMQLLTQFHNLEDLELAAVLMDPFGTRLPVCDTPWGASLRGPIRLQKLNIDGASMEVARVIQGLLNPPFSIALREISIVSNGACDCDAAAQLLSVACATIETIHLNFSVSARMEKLLELVNISRFTNLRVFELKYEYAVWELDLPGLGRMRSEAGHIRHLPVFLSNLPESTEKFIFRFRTSMTITNGVASAHLDFTDWDMLDRVLVRLHTRVPSLCATFSFRFASCNPQGLRSATPSVLPDVAGAMCMRLRRTLACDKLCRIVRFDACHDDA